MRRILIVDPNFDQLLAMTRVLGEDHDVQGCDCLHDALLALDDFQPDLIVTEWKVGDLSGAHVLELLLARCQEKWRAIPQSVVVIEVGYTQTEVARVCAQQRVSPHVLLRSPSLPSDLSQLIVRYVRVGR